MLRIFVFRPTSWLVPLLASIAAAACPVAPLMDTEEDVNVFVATDPQRPVASVNQRGLAQHVFLGVRKLTRDCP